MVPINANKEKIIKEKEIKEEESSFCEFLEDSSEEEYVKEEVITPM